MAYDAARGRVVLFGGIVEMVTYVADTWEWDGASMTWTAHTPAISPAPRGRHGMAFDPGRKRVVMTGGQTVEQVADWELGFPTYCAILLMAARDLKYRLDPEFPPDRLCIDILTFIPEDRGARFDT